MRRGQGALEYLITYGWAILIIVIIGGALFALGVFNPSNWVSNKRATGFSSVQVKDWRATSSGVDLILQNKFGSDINLTVIVATRTSGNCSWYTPDGLTVLSLDGEEQVLADTPANCITGLDTGDTYTMDLQVNFVANGIDHVDSGVLVGKLE